MKKSVLSIIGVGAFSTAVTGFYAFAFKNIDGDLV